MGKNKGKRVHESHESAQYSEGAQLLEEAKRASVAHSNVDKSKRDGLVGEYKEKDKGKGLFKACWLTYFTTFTAPFVCGYLMHKYNNYTTGAWLWASMYSFYCYLYLLKSCIFPDGFEERVNILVAIIVIAMNSLYLYPGYLMFSFQANTEPSAERIAASMLMMVFGMFLVMSADCQKYFTVRAKRLSNPNDRSLITEGMFKWTRNPNYLGEIIVFSSFCNLVNETIPWLIYLGIWVTLFRSNMVEKDRRLKVKQGWEQYFKRSWMLFPKFSTCWCINSLIYLNIIAAVLAVHLSGGIENLIKNAIYMVNHNVYDFAEVRELIATYGAKFK